MPDVELELYRMQAHYVAAVANVELAREERTPETSLRYYRNVDYHGGHTLKAMERMVKEDISKHAHAKDWIVKNHLDVLVFELEALMHLKDWNRIPEFLDHCLKTEHDAFVVAPSYADLAVKINEQMLEDRTYPDIELHKLKRVWFVQEIINRVYKENCETTAVCHWVRCLFQTALQSDAK